MSEHVAPITLYDLFAKVIITQYSQLLALYYNGHTFHRLLRMSDQAWNTATSRDDDDASCESDGTHGTSNVQLSCAKSLAPIEDEEPLRPYVAAMSSASSIMTDDLSSLGQRGIEDFSVASSRYSRVTSSTKSSNAFSLPSSLTPASALGSYKLHELDDMVLEEDEESEKTSIDGDDKSKISKNSKGSKTSKKSSKSARTHRSTRSDRSRQSKKSNVSRNSTETEQPSEASLSVGDLTPVQHSSRTRMSNSSSTQNDTSGSSDSSRPSSFNYQSDSTMHQGNDATARHVRHGPTRPPPTSSLHRPSLRSQDSVSTMSSFGLSMAESMSRSTRSIGTHGPSIISSGTNSVFFGGTPTISESPMDVAVEKNVGSTDDDEHTMSTTKTNRNFFETDATQDAEASHASRKMPSTRTLSDDEGTTSTLRTNREFFGGDETLEGTIGDTYDNSTRSAGWSRFSDGDDMLTVGTNQEFFERALPYYMPGDAQSRGRSKGTNTPTSERSSTPGNTFRSSAVGQSTASVGWDDNTMSTLDTKKRFFEKALPWSMPASSRDGRPQTPSSRGVGERTSAATSTVQNNSAFYDEDGTIMTEGTGYWNEKKRWTDPVKPQRDEATIDTIHEDTIATSDTRSDSYTFSSRGTTRHEYEEGKYSIFSGSSRASTELKSGRSSANSVPDKGVDRPTGIFMRPSHRQNSDPRKAMSREVEVSMDGFLHQVKPPSDDATVASTFSGILDDGQELDKAPWDKSNGMFHRVLTLCSLAGLVATAIFFAVHIGPFHVQPQSSERGASQDSQLAAEGNQTSTTQESELSSGHNVENFPHNIQRAYMEWAAPYGGPSKEVPTLWSYDKSGVEIVQAVFGQCLTKTQAGNGLNFDTEGKAVQAWSAEEQNLRILHLQGQRFVNVDLETGPGIERAVRMGLASSGVAEVAYTPLLQTSAKLYEPREDSTTPNVHGRLMVVFRDPILRAINRFEVFKLRTQDSELTLFEFANNKRFREHNPLTRALIGVSSDTHLSDSLLETAKEVVRRKVLVGLQDRLYETIYRWETFLSWYSSDPGFRQCHLDLLDTWVSEYRIQINYAVVDPEGYNFLLAQHRMDIEVVNFAVQLFEEQGRSLFPQGIAS